MTFSHLTYIIIGKSPNRVKTLKQFRVLLVDDEERILNFLQSKLKARGYDVLLARNGLEAIEQVQAQEPDLVVLDLIMPKMNGLDAIKEIRRFSAVPVIFLSARGSDTDKIRGLELGADDYLAKPFNPDELIARIEAVNRRLDSSAARKIPETMAIGDITVDFKKRLVTVRGEEKSLTRIEWLLFSELALNAGRLLLYDELLTKVWGPEYRDEVQLVRTWISRLRNKIEPDPEKARLIRTVPKTGYILEVPPQSE